MFLWLMTFSKDLDKEYIFMALDWFVPYKALVSTLQMYGDH